MDLLRKILRATRWRLLYQALWATYLATGFLVIDTVFGRASLDLNKVLPSSVCGLIGALACRPSLAGLHKIEDGYYSYHFSYLPVGLRLVGALAVLLIFVPLFIGHTYFYLAMACFGLLNTFSILRFETVHELKLVRRGGVTGQTV